MFGIESQPTTMSVMFAFGLVTMVFTFIFTYASFYCAGLANALDFRWGLHWTSEKRGYLLHCLATITEWCCVTLSIPFYFLCLYRRMRAFKHWDKVWMC